MSNRRTITQQKANHAVKLLKEEELESLVMFFLNQADIRWISILEAIEEYQVEILERLFQAAQDMLAEKQITHGELTRIATIYRSYALYLDGGNGEVAAIILGLVK